jgi:hypothetical protein
VRLPAEWTIPPRDLQVNYYNFLSRRLIPSTDVIVGETRVYRTNAHGCRGDDVPAGAAVLLVVGDDFVHGGPEGSFVDLIEIDPAWPLNGGVEDLTLADAVQRLTELSAEVPVAGALFAPPLRGIGPLTDDETELEARWTAEMDKLPNSAPLALMKPPRSAGAEGAPEVVARFDRFLTDYAAQRGLPLLDAGAAPKRSLLDRLFGRAAPDERKRLARLVEGALGAKVSARAEAAIRGASPAPSSQPASGHGPQDVGRTYPLW